MIATEAKMAQILVRNLEDRLKSRLQRRAKRHGHSMEEEAREILRNALREEETSKRGLGSEMVALFSGSGVYLDEPIAEIRDMRMEIPDFES
jgi:plasmid stability protein